MPLKEIHLVSNSTSFPQMFSGDAEKIFLSVRVFYREGKSRKSLGASHWVYNGSGRKGQLKSNIFPARFLVNVALRYHGEAQCFSHRRVRGIFLEDFHVHIAAVESINLH